jgi:3-oxoacyl-[acyl-carrier-protein] synthase III
MQEKKHYAAITGLGVYLPRKVVTNRDLEQIIDTDDEWIVQRTGIRERRIAGENESTFTMALAAAKQALQMANLPPEELDLIICATFTPEYPFPSTASLVQAGLGASRAGAFDLEAACAGFVYGLSVASAYILSGQANNVLVIGSETLSRVVDWNDRATCVLFGDGAGATLLQKTDNEDAGSIKASALYSDGSKAEHLLIPGGGSYAPTSDQTITAGMHYIKMNGSEVFKNAVRVMASVTEQALAKTSLTLDELDLLIAHQANARIIEGVGKRLEIPAEKVFMNVQNYGNTSAASIPIALYDAVLQGRLLPGMLVALTGFGGGFSCGSMVVCWGLIPD